MTRVFHIALRRRREGKTDYHHRKIQIRSGATRLIIRCTLNNCIIQFAKAEPTGDRIIITVTSKALENYGWKTPCGNISSAYLTGYLTSLKAKKEGLSAAILDVGVYTPTIGSRTYAALKGVLDGGIAVPCDKSIFPDESRIRGIHIANYWNSIEEQAEREHKFSGYLKKGVTPEKIPDIFTEVKQNIEKNHFKEN